MLVICSIHNHQMVVSFCFANNESRTLPTLLRTCIACRGRRALKLEAAQAALENSHRLVSMCDVRCVVPMSTWVCGPMSRWADERHNKSGARKYIQGG
jgi:hypothetical protein